MGYYLNPTNKGFQESIRSEIYVDKTGLIKKMNSLINTEQKYVCVSRPRRFGKSMAVKMLAAYYSTGNDSCELFQNFQIGNDENFEKHLNRYDVIRINMTEFINKNHTVSESIKLLEKRIIKEFRTEYGQIIDESNEDSLMWAMQDVYVKRGGEFIILIDEWDCIFREAKEQKEEQEKYLDFLRSWLKDKEYIALAYMTGILPIKKYGTHSALNMFTEYSMTNSGMLAEYFGFLRAEVQELCKAYDMSFEDMERWYDGYKFGEDLSVYNLKSVTEALLSGYCDTYWNQTENFEALRTYIDMNYDGLRDAVVRMLAGENTSIDVRSFSNDMTNFHSYEDVLTLLVHLGYLAYDGKAECVYIPNKEISKEYITAVKNTSWREVIQAIKASEELLKSVWAQESDKVAEGIEKAHYEMSILQYNNENALCCVISLALYSAREYYTVFRELPTGKGFADLVYIPRKKFADKPAMVIELKYNEEAYGAISQIKDRQYVESLEEYRGQLLLVGISYMKKIKKHKCVIEQVFFLPQKKKRKSTKHN